MSKEATVPIRVVPVQKFIAKPEETWARLHSMSGPYLIVDSRTQAQLGVYFPLADYLELGSEKQAEHMLYPEVDRVSRGDHILTSPMPLPLIVVPATLKKPVDSAKSIMQEMEAGRKRS